MRAYVTGAAGFVGSRLTARLQGLGHEVIATDLGVDVTNAQAVDEAVGSARPDAVVHLAAQSSVASSWKDPAGCFAVNFLGTLHVIQAMERHCPEARLLFVSSGDTYGNRAPGSEPCREADPLSPKSPYAQSKAAAETLATFAGTKGLQVVCTRSFNHTGAGQPDNFVASSFAHQLATMERGDTEAVLRVGNLDSVRDFLDVEDVIDAYVKLLDPGTPTGTYNVASGRPITVREILDHLISLSSVKPEIQVDPERYRPNDYLVGDASRLQEACGWEPRVPLSQTLADLLDAWRR